MPRTDAGKEHQVGPPTILRLARFARGLTVYQLAEITKTDPQPIRALEHGAHVPVGVEGLEKYFSEEFGFMQRGVLGWLVTDLCFIADDPDGATAIVTAKITKVSAVPAKETLNA